MAPPPKYIIERRLIKNVCKNFAPTRPIINESYFTEIFDCWRTYGVASKRCIEAEQKFQFANTQLMMFKKRMGNLNLKRMVMFTLKSPVRPNNKGRHAGFRNKYADMIKLARMI